MLKWTSQRSHYFFSFIDLSLSFFCVELKIRILPYFIHIVISSLILTSHSSFHFFPLTFIILFIIPSILFLPPTLLVQMSEIVVGVVHYGALES